MSQPKTRLVSLAGVGSGKIVSAGRTGGDPSVVFQENSSLQTAKTLKKPGVRYQFKKRMQQPTNSKTLQNQSFPIL